jgi:outer membrane protein assembly factor BamD (BamD/ComL family)
MQFARCLLLYVLILHLHFTATAQPGTTVDLKKPEKYESRTLGSEKTTDGKIRPVKRFYQNTITHYNYVFNANERLNEIIERAKQGFKDDYTKLLPYYNYSLDATATDNDIDTVIYKCTAGILLHDLRNDWVDDLYLLMGRAYYLRKNFDSAERVFAYLNYAFAPKDEGYDLPVGSNETGTEFSISTKEKKKLLGPQPKRNEDIIWIAKNYIEEDKPHEASAILEMLRYDPHFPERLRPLLHETIGYLFYKSGAYDSAAYHLSEATSMDDGKPDKARREYLTAQLFMAAGLKKEAQDYFTKSAAHTIDPYMAVYASLNAINAAEDSSDAADKKVTSLLKLAKKDRYVAYRDLIYYTAAQVLMQSNNYEQAYQFAKQSIKYNVNNPIQRSRSFMLLGDLEYARPDYILAKAAYDSVDAGNLGNAEEEAKLTARLAALQVIAANVTTIHTEDSLQAVARMPEAARAALIKKTVRQLRRAQGLKDEDSSVFVNPAVQLAGNNNNTAANDLFAAQASAKGDWYFNNNALKSSGYAGFRAAWGNRPDVDNWRRMAAVSKQIAAASQGNPDGNDDGMIDTPLGDPMLNGASITENIMNGQVSYDVLLSYLPLTAEKLQESNNKIVEAFFNNGKKFQDDLEDYNAAIASYDSLLTRYPANMHAEETLLSLYYCYNKLGKKPSADSVASIMRTRYKDGKFTAILNNLKNAKKRVADPATTEYERIYNLFIEGKFDEAKTAKATADSLYGNSHWTPQLLFIESIYYISKREDSTAIETLTSLTTQFNNTPLAQKAETMIDVLRRRSEIENYLTTLQVTRLPEDEPSRVVTLNKVDRVGDKKELKADSVIEKKAPVVKAVVDTTKEMKATVRSYVFNASDQQFVGIILNKVDPVYANETRNAFNRYNQINFYNQKINISSAKINDSLNLVLLGPFNDAAEALIYSEKVKPKAAASIIPWLKPEKYSFTIISQSNLDILNDTKDLTGYTEMLEKVLPGKF